jgi:hypothetical protein
MSSPRALQVAVDDVKVFEIFFFELSVQGDNSPVLAKMSLAKARLLLI